MNANTLSKFVLKISISVGFISKISLRSVPVGIYKRDQSLYWVFDLRVDDDFHCPTTMSGHLTQISPPLKSGWYGASGSPKTYYDS